MLQETAGLSHGLLVPDAITALIELVVAPR
jgi:hypothetical protein